jgi:hypothetical protein
MHVSYIYIYRTVGSLTRATGGGEGDGGWAERERVRERFRLSMHVPQAGGYVT